MRNDHRTDSAARHAGEAREDLNRAAGDAADAAQHAGDALRHGREAVQAGAIGVMERADTAADRAAGTVAARAGGMVDRAKSAAMNAAHDTADTVKHAASDAGHRIADEAAAIRAAAGETLESVRSPLLGSAVGALVGTLAGALGGWWAGRALAGNGPELPEEHEEACRVHFVSYTLRPAEMTYDDARPGYLLGYVAASNPDYRGRSYDEVESDLRRGFTDDYAHRYENVRDYARYGFERGSTGW